MAADDLGAALDAFAAKTQAKMGHVVEFAVEALIGDASRPVSAGGNMPVVSGRLRESVKVYINGSLVAAGASAALTAARGAEAGDLIEVTWGAPGTRAPYAAEIEFGSQKVRAHFFARSAAERWQEFVAEAINRASSESP